MDNLGLETIVSSDNVSTDFLQKLNGNMNKLDVAFGLLKNHLLEKTGKNNLTEAIGYVDNLVNAQDATVTADKLFNGVTAYKGTQKITGTALSTPTTATASKIKSGLTAYNQNGQLITGTGWANNTTANSPDILSGKTAYNQDGDLITGNYTPPKAQPTINVTLTGNSASSVSGYGAGINNDGKLVIWAMSSSSAYEHIYFVNTSIGAGAIAEGWNISSFGTSDPTNVPHACTITGLGNYNTINITLEATSTNTTYDYVRVNVTITAS